MIDNARQILSALWPPPIDGSPEHHYSWRVGITMLSIVTGAVLTLHILLVKGMIPLLSTGYLEVSFGERYAADKRREAAKESIQYRMEQCRRLGTNDALWYAQMVQMSVESYVDNGGQVDDLQLPSCRNEDEARERRGDS